MRVHQMSGVGAGRRCSGVDPQILFSAVDPRRHRPIEFRSLLQFSIAELRVEYFRLCSRRAKLCRSFFQKWRAQSDVLRPRDRPVECRLILHRLRDPHRLAVRVQHDTAFKMKLRILRVRTGNQLRALCSNGVRRHARLAVNRNARRCFFRRGSTKKIQAQIVSHDTRQQTGFGIRTVLRMLFRIERGWFDRRPRRRP